MSDLPYNFEFSACAYLNDKLYHIGGMGSVTNRFQIYDIATGVWTDGPNFPDNASGARAQLIEDRFVVLSYNSKTAYDYDPVTNAWIAWTGQFNNNDLFALGGVVLVDETIIDC